MLQLKGACNQTPGQSYLSRIPLQAPNIYAWASTLTATHPLVQNDFHFVLRKALDGFEENKYFTSTIKQGLQEEEGTTVAGGK